MRVTRTAAALAFGLPFTQAQASDTSLDKADAQFREVHFADAQSLYRAIAATSPDFEAAERQLGAIALYENRLDDADEYLRKALERDPDDTKALALLAEAVGRRGDFAQASVLLAKAGKPGRAAAFAAFGKTLPYRIEGSPRARIAFVQTDPLPAVSAEVNGHAGLFLLDTGAAEIVLDPAFAAAAGVKPDADGSGTFAGGRTAGVSFGRIAKFGMGGLAMADVPALLVATAGFSPAAGGRPVAGVIGTGLLSHFLTTLDYPGGALVLEPAGTAQQGSPALASVPFVLVRDHYILARGRVGNAPERAFFIDTGLAGFAFTAPDATLREAGIPVPAPAALPPGSPIGSSPAATFAIRSLSLGTLRRDHLMGIYGPFPASLETGTGVHIAGIVSHAFFRPYAVTFDFVRMMLTLRKSPA